jgi:hypothetical protein
MTKKDYELIARELPYRDRSMLALYFADALKEENQRFNSDKFMEASGV